MSKLKIGFAEESILPGKKISLSGQFYERISDVIESPLTVTAMAIEADGEEAIIVSADIGETQPYLINLAREKYVALGGELDPKKVIIGATHTHSSHTFANPADNIGVTPPFLIIQEYMDGTFYESTAEPDSTVMTPIESTELVTDKIALAAVRAWAARKNAYVANEFGRAAVGMCRRVTYDDGSAAMWGDANTANFVALEGGNDSGIELLYVYDEDQSLIGIVPNIACPAQILGQRDLISADYWGRAKAIIREKLGKDVFFLPLCGAAGDQCPRDLVRWVIPETPIKDPNIKRPNPLKRKADPSMYDVSGCTRAGKRVANEILSVLEEVTDLRDEAVFRHEILSLDLPLRKVDPTEYREADAALRALANEAKSGVYNFENVAKMYVHAGTINRYREQQLKETYNAEVHIIRLGDIALVTCPFELFLDYGNRLKARSYAEQTFIMQLSCGRGGYLPTEKAEKGGHYSAYVASGNVGHEGGDMMIRIMIDHVNRMFKE